MEGGLHVDRHYVRFLDTLSPAKRELVLAGAVQETRRAGSTLTLPARPPRAEVLDRGLMRVYVAAADGRQATVRYIHEGEVLGSLMILGWPAVTHHAQCLTEASVTSLDVAQVRRLAAQDAEVSGAIASDLASRFAYCIELIGLRTFGRVLERLAFDILERASISQLGTGRLVVHATQQELADSIGSAREVVARTMRELRSEDAVTTAPGRVEVLDVAALERIVSGAVDAVAWNG